MKRLPPAKRNQLIAVVVASLALICAIYFLLISPQQVDNQHLQQQIKDRQGDVAKCDQVINAAQATSNELAAVSLQLGTQEKDVASGDVYAWIYDTVHRFKEGRHVNIPNIGQPALGEVDIIPNFPYKQVRLSLNGTGYFHDIGKFVSDFENTFPHLRLVNLTVGSSDAVDGSELLTFQVDVVALVKPNT